MKIPLLLVSILTLCVALAFSQKKTDKIKTHSSGLTNAPESAHVRVNPYQGKPDAVRAGHKLFELHCAQCHGTDARGRGKAPALDSKLVKAVTPGDLFWFVTNGNLWVGMPSWSGLPNARRWQIVTYLKSLQTPQPNVPEYPD